MSTSTTPKGAMSIPEFCAAHGISRSFFRKLVREGNGPDLMHLGGVTRIGIEAAKRWRKAMERSPATHRRGQAGRAALAARAATVGP